MEFTVNLHLHLKGEVFTLGTSITTQLELSVPIVFVLFNRGDRMAPSKPKISHA